MKTNSIFLLAVSLLIGLFAIAVGQNKGAQRIMLKGGKPGDVPFSHHLHQNAIRDCNTCHRLFPQVAGSIEKLKAEGKLKKREAMDQCVECHKKGTTTGGKALPTKCSECHKK